MMSPLRRFGLNLRGIFDELPSRVLLQSKSKNTSESIIDSLLSCRLPVIKKQIIIRKKQLITKYKSAPN